ncbi:MAG: M48 family metallopeptidase [Candidatus Cloacimonetes bacterium]|nr:M48 family metallopeptidase [Candidatus Cloacimonadota bacterium]
MNRKKGNKASEHKHDFAKLRFIGEAELVKILEDDYSFAQYYDIFDNREELENITSSMLSNALLLSPIIAPRIYDICSEIQDKLGYHERIDFYLLGSPEINAFSINGLGIVPHLICFNSALIKQMTDDELRFVIGHEIGHLIYGHSKLNIVQKFLFKNENERPPAMVTLHYFRFVKYSEISADRIGFIAMPDIDVITKVFFKLLCGLSEQYLSFDVKEYLKQLDRIKEYAIGDIFSSHPNPMIRIQALMDYSKSALVNSSEKDAISDAEVNANIFKLLELLEFHPKNEGDLHKVLFLGAAGLYLASLEEEHYEQKWLVLYDWISDYSSQPEKFLEFESYDLLVAKTKEICLHYADKQDNDKFSLMEKLVFVTLLDGRLEPEEKKRLLEIAAMMNISVDATNIIIRKCSESYLAPNKKMNLNKFG